MRTARIFVDQPLATNAELSLDADAAEHLGRVLRARVGDPVVLFNGDGSDYHAELVSVARRQMRARVLGQQSVDRESPLRLVLAQGLARGDKMDLIVQKATELGVTAIVPLWTERSGVRLDPARARKRVQHWRKVAISACEQCERALIPDISPIQNLEQWCGLPATDAALKLALWPQATRRVRDLTIPASGALLVAGPEGGFGQRDIASLTAADFTGLRLGPRILRTETAGLAALAALQATYGDL